MINNTSGDTFDLGAYWEELHTVGDAIDESIMNVEGGNFRASTIPAHEHNARFKGRPPKKNYDVQFDRPPFIRPVLLPELNASGNLKNKSNGEHRYKEAPVTTTVPNLQYLFANGIGFDSNPDDWFNLYLAKNCNRKTHPKAATCDDLTGELNIKAMVLGSGKIGGKYKGFVDFNKQELMAHLAIYFLHAISPSPQVGMKFKNQTEDPVNGSDLCHSVFV